MTNRTGYETDVAAIAELFRDDKNAGEQVVADYLRPRSKHVPPGSRGDRRDHFWSLPTAPHELMTPTMLAAARLVEAKLSALGKPEFNAAFVGKAVAAIYCGCSEPELDRRIRSPQTDGLETLERLGDTRVENDRREFRMSRVKELKGIRVPASEGRKPPAAPAAGPAPSSPPLTEEAKAALTVHAEVSASKISVTLEMALTDETPWVEDKDGKNIGHLLVGALQSPELARVLTEGGNIVLRTLRDALTRPWVSLEARAPWADGYAALLARETRAMEVADAVARHRDFSDFLPPVSASDDTTRI
jgi:hypothetical protein